MAFDLQKVLRALLFSTNQPLSIKDVQDIFTRFHDQKPPTAAPALALADQPAQPAQTDQPAQPDTPAPAPATDASETELVADDTADAELYQDVPSLITAAQIREAMDAISAALAAANDIYILIEGPTGYRIATHPRYARWIRIMRNEPPPVRLSQSALETLAVVAYRQPVTRGEIENIRGVSAEAGLNKLLERELIYITGRADLPGRPLQYSTTDKFLDFVGVKTLVELPASDVLSSREIDSWLQNASNIKPPADADMGLPLEEGEGASPNLATVTVAHNAPPLAQPAQPDQSDPSDQSDQSDQPASPVSSP